MCVCVCVCKNRAKRSGFGTQSEIIFWYGLSVKLIAESYHVSGERVKRCFDRFICKRSALRGLAAVFPTGVYCASTLTGSVCLPGTDCYASGCFFLYYFPVMCYTLLLKKKSATMLK